ncbi:MAG: hypothetical protein ACYTG7_18935, partial [Planctomycetota bacterium]
KVRFGPDTSLNAGWEPLANSETYGEETHDSIQQPFASESYFTYGTDSLLAHAGDRALLENSVLANTPVAPFQEAPQSEDPDRWSYRFTPHLWFPSMSGDTTVRGLKSEVGMSMSDVMDMTSIALFENFTARKGRWFVYHFGMYSLMEDDARVFNQKIETTSTQAILDFAVGYNVLEGSVDTEKEQEVSLGLYGGVRYQYLKSEIDIDSLFVRVDEDHDWLEPLVGGYLGFDITEDFVWDAMLLDLSGFGIGSASELTVNFYSGIKYRLGETCFLVTGYKIMDFDYDRGSGFAGFGQDLSMVGPVVGFSFSF